VLAAQALVEELALLSKDGGLKRMGAEVVLG
jgi:hypothetical protein